MVPAGMKKKIKRVKRKRCNCYEDVKSIGVKKKMLFELDKKLKEYVHSGPIFNSFSKEEIEELMPGYASHHPDASKVKKVSKLIKKAKEKLFPSTQNALEEPIPLGTTPDSPREEKGSTHTWLALGVLTIPAGLCVFFKRKRVRRAKKEEKREE